MAKSQYTEVDVGRNRKIHIQSLRGYLRSQSNLLRIRLRFLIWEVDIELIEAFSGYAVLAVLSDIINLVHSHKYNNIYDVLFKMLPPMTWVYIASVIVFTHAIAIFMDRSADADFDYTEKNALGYLFVRSRMMFLAFMFNACVTLSVVVGHSYVLVWKYQVLFVLASLLSYIRLNIQYTDYVKRKKAPKDVVSTLER